MTLRRRPLTTLASTALTLAAVAAGCETAPPGGGFLNPNPGSVVERDKPAVRTDLPVPDTKPSDALPVAEPPSTAGASAADHSSGDKGKVRQTAPEAASTPPASPPRKDGTGNAQGATRPDGPIKEGTLRSPQ